MRVQLKKFIETIEEKDVYIGRNIYLVILRITPHIGGQFVRVIPTFNYKGNPPYSADWKNVEVVAVYEYRLTDRETVPTYEVYGDSYIWTIT